MRFGALKWSRKIGTRFGHSEHRKASLSIGTRLGASKMLWRIRMHLNSEHRNASESIGTRFGASKRVSEHQNAYEKSKCVL